jgi:hypothetical protein
MTRPKRIKQIMPIPEGFGILARVTGDDGQTEMVDLTKSGFCYLLALVAGDDWDDYVVPYEFDQYGLGELNEDAFMFHKQCCPICKQEMAPQWDKERVDPLWFLCDCHQGG